MKRGTTALIDQMLPQERVPSLIWITSINANIRKMHPKTEPKADKSIPNLRKCLLMGALKTSCSVLLLIKSIACFKPCATKLEKRKELNDTTWNVRRFLAMSSPAMQALSSTNVAAPGVVIVKPTNTANVNKEFTLMRPSSAETWMLVVPSLNELPGTYGNSSDLVSITCAPNCSQNAFDQALRSPKLQGTYFRKIEKTSMKYSQFHHFYPVFYYKTFKFGIRLLK